MGRRKGPSKSLREDFVMSRVPSLSSPFLLGFDEIERALDRVVKGADGYPPYNIERCDRSNGQPERLRITLAVAGLGRLHSGARSEPGISRFRVMTRLSAHPLAAVGGKQMQLVAGGNGPDALANGRAYSAGNPHDDFARR